MDKETCEDMCDLLVGNKTCDKIIFDGNTKCAETTRENEDAHPCVLHLATQGQTINKTEQNCQNFVGTTWDGSACQITQKTLGEVEGIKFRTLQGTAFSFLHRYPPLSTTTFPMLGGGVRSRVCASIVKHGKCFKYLRSCVQ